MKPENAFGYAAIVVPAKFFWQAFFVPDPKTLAPYVGQAIAAAATGFQAIGKEASDDDILGAMLAGLASTIRSGDEARAAIFAAAVVELSGERFFVVDVTDEPGGTATRLSPLEVATVDAARAQIETRVQPLKLGLLLRTMK